MNLVRLLTLLAIRFLAMKSKAASMYLVSNFMKFKVGIFLMLELTE